MNRFLESNRARDQLTETVSRAAENRIGNDLEGVLSWFKEKPFTRKEVTAAWETGSQEGEDASTLWGMVQGLTAHARDIPYLDKRVNLERRARALLGK